jgi:hypothetical protein
MSQYQFTNPGAMAGLAIARLLADRDEEVHKRREEDQRTKESEARIAAQKDTQDRQNRLDARMAEQDAMENATRLRAAMARGDQLTPDQMGVLTKGHMESTFDKYGGKKLDSTAVSGTVDTSGAAPAITNMTATPVTGSPDPTVDQYGIARATPMDLQRDSDRAAREDLARITTQSHEATAQANAEAAAQRAREAQQAAADRAADRNNTMLTIAGMSNGLRQDAAAEKKADKEKVEARQQSTLSGMADETLNAIDQLITVDPKTHQPTGLADGTKYIVGGLRMPGFLADSGLIPKATAAKAALDNLKSRLVVDLIGEMKSQSKTGATGFGQLSDKERVLLENSIGRLQSAQDEKTFYTELLRIRDKVAKIKMPAARPVDGTTVTIDFRKSGS